MKYLIIYLFTMVDVLAGFPPTTVKSQNDTVKQTTFNLETPNYQATSLNGTTKLIETGNANELVNPSFEHSTVAYGWSIANGVSSSSSAAVAGKKANSIALSGALEFYQEVSTVAAQKASVQMTASLWVNSTDVSDLQLCSLKNGSEDKCTVSGGYVQGSGWRQLTVSFLGDATSNGLKIKSTDTTGTVLVDQAYVGIGSPVVDFTPDNVYSAKFTNTGVTSDENTDWVNGNASVSSNDYTITFTSGIFTVTPNCFVTSTDTAGDDSFGVVSVASSTSITVSIYDIAGGLATRPFNVICQKQGADYKTSKAYVASAGNQGLEAGTIIPTSAATCPAGTLAADGSPVSRTTYSELFAKIGVTHGQGDGSTTFNVPDYRGRFLRGVDGAAGNDTDKSSRTAMNTGGNTGNNVGSIQGDQFGSHTHTINVWFGENGTGPNQPNIQGYGNSGPYSSGSTLANGGTETRPKNAYVNYCIRTTSQSTIVGSFQGYNETPGTSRVETFSFSYGTTNATTICSASPCSYLDQIGSAVTSVTRSGTGAYRLNTSKTFTKLKCAQPSFNLGGTGRGTIITSLQCSNCSSIVFQIHDSHNVNQDAAGTMLCQGIPQ